MLRRLPELARPPTAVLERAADKVALCLEYLDLAALHPVKQSSLVFHCRRMLRDELTRYQLLEEAVTSQSLAELRGVVELAQRYRETPAGTPGAFPGFDAGKEKRQKEASARKKREESKRKDFEARMVRKAKREGKDPNAYLVAPPPSVDDVATVKAMVCPQVGRGSGSGSGSGSGGDADAQRAAQMALWREKWPQHCFSHHVHAGGCPRERRCAFLHGDATGASKQRHEDAPSWLEEKQAAGK